MPRKIPTHRPKWAAGTKATVRRVYDAQAVRREQKRFYCSEAWRRLRSSHLAEFPLCQRCPSDRPTPAVEVHHREPRDVRPDLQLDPDNLEGLCRACHRKTRAEDRAHRRSGANARTGTATDPTGRIGIR